MGLFNRTKTAGPPPPDHDAGKKIILNFGGQPSKAVLAMAAATLEAGGYIEPQQPREPQIGDKMPDGTVYAGVSPDTGKAMYAMPADVPLTLTFNAAKKYAKNLDAHGHHDWRVPTKDELNMLFNNRAAIGGFNLTGSGLGWYWSASKRGLWNAWSQCFSDGCRDYLIRGGYLSVRCVR